MQRKRNEESQPIKKRRFLSFALEWQVETALKVYVILKGFALKNLHPNESIVRSLTYVRDDKRCHSDDRNEEESLLKWIWRRGFLVGLTPLLGITWLSFWTERSEVKNLLPRDVTLTVIYHSEKLFLEESPSNGIRRFLVFTRNDNHLGFLTLGLPASIRNNKREGFPIFTIRNTMK